MGESQGAKRAKEKRGRAWFMADSFIAQALPSHLPQVLAGPEGRGAACRNVELLTGAGGAPAAGGMGAHGKRAKVNQGDALALAERGLDRFHDGVHHRPGLPPGQSCFLRDPGYQVRFVHR